MNRDDLIDCIESYAAGFYATRSGAVGVELADGTFVAHTGRVMPRAAGVWHEVDVDVDDLTDECVTVAGGFAVAMRAADEADIREAEEQAAAEAAAKEARWRSFERDLAGAFGLLGAL